MNDIFARAHKLLNFKDFSQFVPPVEFDLPKLLFPSEKQYILRMMVHRQNDGYLTIPKSLTWLEKTVEYCCEIQKQNGLDPYNDFIYITVRNGIVDTIDDDVWHVDGFSMRVPHRPEQNYFFSNVFPTEVLGHGFTIPEDFDPLKHNIHTFFQENADESKLFILPTNKLVLFDPYIVHRRPKASKGSWRTFFRISFVPVEILDDLCEPNPHFPFKLYGRESVKDMRDKLTPYRKNNL